MAMEYSFEVMSDFRYWQFLKESRHTVFHVTQIESHDLHNSCEVAVQSCTLWHAMHCSKDMPTCETKSSWTSIKFKQPQLSECQTHEGEVVLSKINQSFCW